MKTTRLFSAIAAAVMLLAGCAKAPTSVSVNPASLSLTEGESAVLVATVLPENAKYGSIQWTSSDDKVATVSDGRVVAVGAGSATIKATAEGVSGTATVTVLARFVPVEKVVVTDETGADRGLLTVGQTVQLKAQVLPANATEQDIYWTSTTEHATVDANGLVTAVSIGDCVIRAHAKNEVFGEYYVATDPVWVEKLEVTDTEGKSEGTAERGKPVQLQAWITPANASFPEIQWSVDDGTVATVDETGLVMPLKVGKVTVTAKVQAATAHPMTASYTLTVTPAQVTGVEVIPATLVITEGKQATLTVKITPEDVEYPGILWSSTNTPVATVSSEGVVTAIKPGKTKIYAYTADGSGKSGFCDVTVEEDRTLKGISLSSELVNLKVGDTKTLTVNYTPANASNKNVTWSSSDASVASVADGVVTAKATGQAEITATSEEGGFKATCRVFVSSLPSNTRIFTLDENRVELYLNGEKLYSRVWDFAVSGEDVYYISHGQGFYKNGVKMQTDAIAWYSGESIQFRDMTVLGDKLYILALEHKSNYARVLILDLNTGKITERDFIKVKLTSYAGISHMSMTVASDGTIYVLTTVCDEYKQDSTRQYKISTSGQVEETILFTDSRSLDSTGASNGDAYESSALDITTEGTDVYAMVYRETAVKWKYIYNTLIYKNGKVIHTIDNTWLANTFLSVSNGKVYTYYRDFDNVKHILCDGTQIYGGFTHGILGLVADSKNNVYYSIYDESAKVYKMYMNDTTLFSSPYMMTRIVVVE